MSRSRKSSGRRASNKRTQQQDAEQEEAKQQYFRRPILGREPQSKCEAELERELQKECRQPLHIGASYVSRGDRVSSQSAPYAVRSIDRPNRLLKNLSSECRRELNPEDFISRPLCGEAYNFPGIPTEELFWYYLERSRAKSYADFFANFPEPDAPPYRNAEEERRARAVLLEILQEFQRMKDSGELKITRARGSGRRASKQGSPQEEPEQEEQQARGAASGKRAGKQRASKRASGKRSAKQAASKRAGQATPRASGKRTSGKRAARNQV